MSFHVSVTPYEEGKSERIGTNGSQTGLMLILFAGYAAGNWPESKRVRSWVGPDDISFRGSDYHKLMMQLAPNLPTQVRLTRNRKDMQALVAYNHDDRHWIAYETTGGGYGVGARPQVRTIDAGLKMKNKQPQCPVLQGLVRLYRLITETDVSNDYIILEGEPLKEITASFRAVLPTLEKSDWYGKVQRTTELLEYAVTNNKTIRAG